MSDPLALHDAAVAALAQRRPSDAVQAARACLDALGAAGPLDRGRALLLLAQAAQAAGEPALSLEAAAEARDLGEEGVTEDGGPDAALLMADALTQIGVLHRAAGRWADSRAALEAALQLARDVSGELSPDTAALHNHLGMLGKYEGDFADAEVHYAAALEILEPAGPSEDLADLLHNLAGLAHARGRPAEGEEPARRGLAVRRSLRDGADDAVVAADLAGLAAVLEETARLADAEQVYREALAAYDADGGRRTADAAVTLNNLGTVAARRGRPDEAETWLKEALAVREQVHGPQSWQAAVTRANLAEVLAGSGRTTEAARLDADADRVLREVLPPGHPVRAARGL